MTKILITGCNGLIACRLAKRLSKENVSVFGISKNGLTNPYIAPNRYLQADICRPDVWAPVMDKIQPDVVIHCAAITKPDIAESDPALCYATNFLAVKSLLAETEKREIDIIHLSTDFVFAGTHGQHTESSDDFPPPNAYGKSKYEAERYILQNHPSVAIVRTALVYGYEPLLPRGNIFTWALDALRKGKSIRVVDDQFRTPTFADDLAEGIYALVQKRPSGIYHLAGNEFMSVYDFVCQIARVFHLDETHIIPVKTATLNEPAQRPPSTRLMTDKARRELDYRPNTVVHNLRSLYRQYCP